MKRPAFQFYTGDWQGNSKLKRCSHAHKGVWVDVMCLMHDSDEYGILRWPLGDIAQAVGVPVRMLKELRAKEVLKGAEEGEMAEPFIYTPRHAGKDGEPVTLIPAQPGPIWYSSRMVRDEYVRSKRGEGTRFGDEPKAAPKPPIGDGNGIREGDGPSSSTSSSTSKESKTLSGKPDLRPQAIEILNFLNAKAGKAFRPVDQTLKPIIARLRDGYSPDDIRAVVVAKCREWLPDPKMAYCVRPKTLFGAENFANYEGQLQQVSNEQTI